MNATDPAPPLRVLLLGATGTIGRATARALVARGHHVVCFVRKDAPALVGAEVRVGDPTDPVSLTRDGFRGEHFDAAMSCLASRTGARKDAWAVDYRANAAALAAAKAAGAAHFVLLSAICVQKPLLAFQQAKLAFEAELIASGLRWSIVRPTAFFKSLSGQVARVAAGKPYLMFGDGELTACKPVSDGDLGAYLADCLTDEDRWNRVLAVGGPGPAITPKQQGEAIFALLGREPKFRRVPVGMLDAVIAVLGLIPPLRAKAELAKIGRYYATESMLVLDPVTGKYDADATPETGTETLFDYYAQLIRGETQAERGDHAVF